MEVPDDAVDGVVECPRCGTSARPFPVADDSVDPSEERTVLSAEDADAAGEAFLYQEAVDDFSGPEDVKACLLEREVAFRNNRLGVRDLESAGPRPGGRLRGSTLFLLLAAVLVPALTYVACVYLQEREPFDLLLASVRTLAVVFSGLLLLATPVFVISDLLVPGLKGRTDPARGLKFFLGAMRFGRYERARYALLPGGFDFTASDLAEVWAGRLRKSADLNETLRLRGFSVSEYDDEVAVAVCNIEMSSTTQHSQSLGCLGAFLGIPGLVISLANRKETQATHMIRKLMRRADGQWYVVNGEYTSPEDAPMAFDEAVRISKLSDSELAAEARATGIHA